MIVPFILLIASLMAVVAAVTVPGLSDLLLLAGPCALASLFLLARASLRAPAPVTQTWAVVDGSNVMYWKDGTPGIAAVQEVLAHLSAHGFTPGVVFDANAGHLIAGRYLHDGALSHRLGLPEDRVMVVNKGTPADPVLLAAARDLGARIVSNDRYRDWADTHPEVYEPGHIIRGGYRDGALWLDLAAGAIATPDSKPALPPMKKAAGFSRRPRYCAVTRLIRPSSPQP